MTRMIAVGALSIVCIGLLGAQVIPDLPGATRSHTPTLPRSRVPTQACPAPRPSQWAATRDSLWPLIAHKGGDEAWAHLEASGLPGASATWCNPLQGDSEAVRAGRQLYGTWCASCHGDTGRGDGPGAAQATPTPYDFTRPEFAGMREPPGPAVLYAIMTHGVGGTMMRGFERDLGGWERLAVLAYVTQLPGGTAIRGSRDWADSLRVRRQAGSYQ